MNQKTPKSSPFSQAEVAAELERMRSTDSATTWHSGRMLTCIHCNNEFDATTGGNADVPICDHCLHSD